MVKKTPPSHGRWLLLIHQIPPKPAYFRAKVGRRLHRIGAVAIKNSVYVLPRGDPTQEDLQWMAREIVAEGGDATLCSADLLEGLRDAQVEALFQAARDADYAEIGESARAADDDVELARLKKRLVEVVAIDFFGAPGRIPASEAVASLEKRLRPRARRAMEAPAPKREAYNRRTWVTRKDVHVDRIASAWLIGRFIDPKGKFKFVRGQGYRAKHGEVTYDMFEADFTHIGDRCTFEVLVDRFALTEPGLRAIAEIVHDIDVKDGKFGRAEAPGFTSMIAGIALTHARDEDRIEAATPVLEGLLQLHRRRRS